MSSMNWLTSGWISVLQTGLIALGLFVIGIAELLNARSRKIANLIHLTKQHRELWERMFNQPELTRILDPQVDLTGSPATPDEEMFVVFIILHLSSAFYALKSGFFQKMHGLRNDIERFFSLPIPRAVWEKTKSLQEPPFVKFVERCIVSARTQ